MQQTQDDDEPEVPRHQRRYPYRALNPDEQRAINFEVEVILERIDPMLIQLVRDRLPRGAEAELDDILQEVRFKLWVTCLPKFDAWRKPKVKVSTFLRRCARDAVVDEIRKLRKRKHSTQPIAVEPAAPDQSLDHEIEQLAEQIRAEPERYLKATKSLLLMRLLAGDSPAVIARAFDVEPKRLWNAIYKLKMRISELAPAKCA